MFSVFLTQPVYSESPCTWNTFCSLGLIAYHYLVRAGFFDLSDHLENPEHHPHVMECDTLTPKDIRLSGIQQTTNPLIERSLSEIS